MVCWSVFNSRLSEDKEKSPACSICQFLRYKYSHRGLLQATEVTPLEGRWEGTCTASGLSLTRSYSAGSGGLCSKAGAPEEAPKSPAPMSSWATCPSHSSSVWSLISPESPQGYYTLLPALAEATGRPTVLHFLWVVGAVWFAVVEGQGWK